jgi:HK97 family phage portal protein
MPVLDRVLNRFGLQRKQEVPIINDGAGNKPTIRVVGKFGSSGSAVWGDRDYNQLANTGYRANSDVYACVSLIAGAGKQVKWGVDVDLEVKQNDESLKLLATGGAIPQTENIAQPYGSSFIESWLSYLLLSGNAYIELGRASENGPPVSIYLLQPDQVKAETNLNKPGADYTQQPRVEMWQVKTVGGAYRPVRPADMIHSKLFNPLDPIFGMSPLEAAMLRVDAQNEAAMLLKRVLERGFSPGWIEAAKDSIWEETQVAALRERLKMSKHAGEELFLENATWHEMGFKPIDADISNQHLLSKRDIASVFHVDPVLIGDTSSRTYATYRESRLALYMEAVAPLLQQFKQDWNRMIGAPLNSRITPDKNSFDAIAAARAEATDRVHKLWTAGLITQNEGRQDLDYQSVTGGDVFYAPANLVPLGIEAEQSEQETES